MAKRVVVEASFVKAFRRLLEADATLLSARHNSKGWVVLSYASPLGPWARIGLHPNGLVTLDDDERAKLDDLLAENASAP